MGLFDSWSVSDYEIHLASPVVAPGQMVSGNVVFTVTSEMSFRKVTFKVIGREYTHIQVQKSSGSGKNRRTRTVHYIEKRNFFKVHITPLGMPKWGNSSWQGTLAPGTYNFPFAVRVPPDALPSMQVGSTQTASVQYYVKSKIDIPFGPDSEKLVNFLVTTAMPEQQAMSAVPYFSQPTRVPRTCCCCCNSGFTSVTYSFDKNIVVIGPQGVLSGHLTINNAESGEATKVVQVTLSQHTTLTAQGYTRVALTPVNTVPVVTNLEKKQAGEHTFAFSLPLATVAEAVPRAATFRGALIVNTYLLTITCDGDLLGQVHINAGSAVDPTNTVPPVQSEVVTGRTVMPKEYPRFLYAPPPGATPIVPMQKENVGPFNAIDNSIPPVPY